VYGSGPLFKKPVYTVEGDPVPRRLLEEPDARGNLIARLLFRFQHYPANGHSADQGVSQSHGGKLLNYRWHIVDRMVEWAKDRYPMALHSANGREGEDAQDARRLYAIASGINNSTWKNKLDDAHREAFAAASDEGEKALFYRLVCEIRDHFGQAKSSDET
jgi:hypothetical protein